MGGSSRHFSKAFRAFSTDFSTSVRDEARNLLSTLPFAGFTVSIQRFALFEAKKLDFLMQTSALDSYKLTGETWAPTSELAIYTDGGAATKANSFRIEF